MKAADAFEGFCRGVPGIRGDVSGGVVDGDFIDPVHEDDFAEVGMFGSPGGAWNDENGGVGRFGDGPAERVREYFHAKVWRGGGDRWG